MRFMAALLLATPVMPLAAQDLFLTGGRLLDPATRQITEANILIEGGRISGFPATAPASFTGRTVDVSGRWIMPALADMHTHSFGNAAAAGQGEMLGPAGVAAVALRAGVARYLDLFSAEDQILGVRDRQRAGGVPGAEIFAAGPCLTATRGHCSEYGVPTRLVDTPEDARREVDDLAPKKPDVIKVVYDHTDYGARTLPSIDRATLEAVVSAARSHGLPTVVHVGTWADLRDAVEVGAFAVTHTPRGALPEDLPALMASRGTLHIPTLAVQSDQARFLDDPSLLDSPLLAGTVAKAVVDGFRQAPAPNTRGAGWLAWQRAGMAGDLTAVRTLAEAGVPMVTGTDAGNPAVFQGYSVHRELRLLVEAGLSPWEALAGATVNAGRLLGRDWGMSPGAEGTLIVLEASPVDDIRHTERLVAVVQRGRVVSGPWKDPAGGG